MVECFKLVGCINWGKSLLLKLVIDNINSDELETPTCCAQSDFIEAALRAAKYSKSNTRVTILNEVCSMLNCKPEDLGFLFQSSSDQNAPQNLKLNLPDYRLSAGDLYLEAAE